GANHRATGRAHGGRRSVRPPAVPRSHSTPGFQTAVLLCSRKEWPRPLLSRARPAPGPRAAVLWAASPGTGRQNASLLEDRRHGRPLHRRDSNRPDAGPVLSGGNVLRRPSGVRDGPAARAARSRGGPPRLVRYLRTWWSSNVFMARSIPDRPSPRAA